MAIYLYIPGVPGSTSAKGYEQWIPILAMDWGAGRVIETASGNVADRIRSNTSGVEMEIIKQMDQASPLLFAQVWGGKAIPEVQIHACYAGANSFIPYLQYTLSNVMFSEYSAHVEADSTLELIGLNYTDIENSFTEYDSQCEIISINRAASQIGSQPSFASYANKQMRAGTEEGFKLFVAVVYGEMAGARGSPEKGWEAVGSVIMNRVGKGIWWRHHTVESIVNRGFDAYMNPKKIKNWDKLDLEHQPLKDHKQFLKAWASSHSQNINQAPPMNRTELATIRKMQEILKPIFYNHKRVTDANFYYSPRGMFGKPPPFLINIDHPEQYRVYVSGLNEKDIILYNIPTEVSRKAGK